MYYTKNPECIYEQMEDGIIVFNELNEDTIVLNQTAAYLFEHCQLGTTEAIIQSLITALDHIEEHTVVEQECKECINQMVRVGILLEVDDAQKSKI